MTKGPKPGYKQTAEHKAKVAASKAARGHGLSRTPTYSSWSAMKQRCLNPENKSYADYGARGITVCERWLKSFEDFYADMGPRPEGMTLDRRDSTKGYSPDNCRWATHLEQRLNQIRTTRMADCHPDSEHVAFGLCNACYKKVRRRVADVGG